MTNARSTSAGGSAPPGVWTQQSAVMTAPASADFVPNPKAVIGLLPARFTETLLLHYRIGQWRKRWRLTGQTDRFHPIPNWRRGGTRMRADEENQSPNRRNMLAGIGVAAAAAAVTRFTTAEAAAPETGGEFWNKQYTAKKGEVNLALYRRRMKAPTAGDKPLPVVIMVHGSSISGMPSWDLHVPGAGEYSVMNVFTRFGYDCWVIDFEGYGRSTVTSGNSDVKSGVADLEAAAPLIAQETGQQRFHMLGESSGALRVAAFAAAHPERVDRVVLGAYTYTGKGSPTLADRAKQVD